MYIYIYYFYYILGSLVNLDINSGSLQVIQEGILLSMRLSQSDRIDCL